MFKWYKQGNEMLLKTLWWLVIAGLIAALPLAYARYQTETSANNVEIVFDYRDLLHVADTQPNPGAFIEEQLAKMKEVGVTSLAVYEMSLQDLRESRKIDVFTSREVSLQTQNLVKPEENYTYILFKDKESQDLLQSAIERGFSEINTAVESWSWQGRTGLKIELGRDDALLRPLAPDLKTIQMIKDHGLQVVIRLSNKRPFNADKMESLLRDLNRLGVTRLAADSDAMPGVTGDKNDLKKMSQLLNKYSIGIAIVEMSNVPQEGLESTSKWTHYNAVRLHSLSSKESDKLLGTMRKDDLEKKISDLADRFVLAVKDRNIRMIYIHCTYTYSLEIKKVQNSLESLYESLAGEGGAIKRIEQAGYSLGPAEAFKAYSPDWLNVWRQIAAFLLLIGAVSLITLLFSRFIPELSLLCFAALLAGFAGLHFVSQSKFEQLLALGTAISAPSIAMIMAVRTIRSRCGRPKIKSDLVFSLAVLIRTSAVSLVGAVYLIALLNQLSYFLVLHQFRGVSILHLLPVVIAGLHNK